MKTLTFDPYKYGHVPSELYATHGVIKGRLNGNWPDSCAEKQLRQVVTAIGATLERSRLCVPWKDKGVTHWYNPNYEMRMDGQRVIVCLIEGKATSRKKAKVTGQLKFEKYLVWSPTKGELNKLIMGKIKEKKLVPDQKDYVHPNLKELLSKKLPNLQPCL